MKSPKGITRKLNERRESDSFRSLRIHSDGIDFFSNDYLGIARLKFDSNFQHGATGSRLISGHFKYTEHLESFAASFYEQPSATLYNSGYDANIGFFSCVPQRGDTIIYDELSHASIRDGIQMSFAKSYNFRHNDLEHLEERLSKAKGEVYVAVEAIYSMDGDKASLIEIAHICQRYEAYLIVDEAHSGGVFGKQGRGLVNELGLDGLIFAKLITFGKALGSHGALMLGSADLKDYLVNFSRSLIYTTALPPSNLERIDKVINHVSEGTSLRIKLKGNIELFKDMASTYEINILDSDSPIQGVIIPGNDHVKAKAFQLEEAGFMVKAILSPTVPKGKERIRICLHSFNTHKEIIALIKALNGN